MGHPSHEWSKLRDETEQVRLDFIRTDLEVCLTLADLAETRYSLGNREHAEQTLASAEKGYSDLLRLFSQANNLTPESAKELWLKFKRLREPLDGLKRLG